MASADKCLSESSQLLEAVLNAHQTSNVNVSRPTLQLTDLSNWQKSKLCGISMEGVQCYLQGWYQLVQHPMEGYYCDVAWDEIYCWPATRAGGNVSRLCSEVMKDDPEVPNAADIIGSAFRICRDDGTWEWDGWTNYNQCMESLVHSVIPASEGSDSIVVDTVRHVLLVGSLISALSILLALFIFYYFKSLHGDRVTVQMNLMLALLLRSLLMIIISEPFGFPRETNYRTVNWICKTVVALYLLATAMSTNWMFIQGHFVHARVTTNIFDLGTPFQAYFAAGWGFPMLLILIWAYAMELDNHTHCWKHYGKSQYIWIIVGPMIFALVANLIFLINILRILLTKIHLATLSSDWTKFRRAVKATMVLGPMFGVNNLLFCYNPGGIYEPIYMITNAFFQATQGAIVTVVYCFSNKDVHLALQREYYRFKSRRFNNNGSTLIALKYSTSLVRH